MIDLSTPCALIDLRILERNCSRMADHAAALGVRLRPHVKTHKTVEAARMQVRGHFGGITVSTLAEARAFADAGFRDLTYAFPFPLPRLEEAAALASRVDRLGLLVDQGETVEAIERFARDRGAPFALWLKVDCGYHRAGVDPAGEEGVAIARRIAGSPHLVLIGVLTHAGHAYACRDRDGIREVAREERDVTVAFAARLRGQGIEVPEVSVGSTPTACLVDDLAGVTEIRPGNYAFFDVFQATIGTCSLDDVALSILTTVVGRYPSRDEIVVDAGALALSRDPGPTHVEPSCGFGVVAAADGSERFEDLRVVALSQEHGVIRGPGAAGLVVGTRLRILPDHACLAAAGHDRIHVVRDGEAVDVWRPARGW